MGFSEFLSRMDEEGRKFQEDTVSFNSGFAGSVLRATRHAA